MKKRAVCSTLFAAAFFCANAQDGILDVTFGTGGTVITDFHSAEDNIRGVGIQSDGKIVVGGVINNISNNDDFAVARYNSDGTPDNTFGTGGKFTKDFNGHSDVGRAMVIQSDGKILLTGYAAPGAPGEQFTTIRLNADGTLDAGFGTAGVVTHQIGSSRSVPNSIILQGDGKILVGGMYKTPADELQLAIVRYLANGSMDNTFGTSGVVMTTIYGDEESIESIALQPDGKIVATGKAYDPIDDYDDAFIIRFNADGIIDNTFGTAGKVVFGDDYDDAGNSISVDAGGFIYVAGLNEHGSLTSEDIYVTKRNPDGSPVTTFGTAGEVIYDLGTNDNEFALDLLLQPNGKILIGGIDQSTDGDILIMRFNSDGSVDSTFGTSGIINNNIQNFDVIFSMALQSDGKIIAAGASNDDFLVQRYTNQSLGIAAVDKAFSTFELFPNPVTGHASLNINMLRSGNLKIEIYDVLGAKVQSYGYRGVEVGDRKLSLNMTDIKPGIYTLRAISDMESGELRFIRN